MNEILTENDEGQRMPCRTIILAASSFSPHIYQTTGMSLHVDMRAATRGVKQVPWRRRPLASAMHQIWSSASPNECQCSCYRQTCFFEQVLSRIPSPRVCRGCPLASFPPLVVVPAGVVRLYPETWSQHQELIHACMKTSTKRKQELFDPWMVHGVQLRGCSCRATDVPRMTLCEGSPSTHAIPSTMPHTVTAALTVAGRPHR